MSHKNLIEKGLKIAESKLYSEDKIWSCYSGDKVDIGEHLAAIIRVLLKALPLSLKLRALSIGSSNEPQFRILETAFRGGLYLLDIEKEALLIVQERIHRQRTDHVITILGDYNKIFLDFAKTKLFLKNKLGGQKVDLITLHHSLYYCKEDKWHIILHNLYQKILKKRGVIHAVLMSAESEDRSTTTWLYNYFVGKYFGFHNNQDLRGLKMELQEDYLFNKARIGFKKSKVHFYTDDFEKFMAVVWMILLYPEVHKYTLKEREEITEFVYKKFWMPKKPLWQTQDHMIIYKGI